MKITREYCREYAHRQIEVFKDNSSVLRHMAFRYLNLEPIVNRMGGFANFRHYFCNQIYLREIKQLQENVEELESITESWMNDYQKLKDKYEPTILATQ